MPQAATANMLLVKPTEGSDAGLWDFYLNALIDLIDAHDHSTGKGVKVKTNGLDINADLTLTSGGTASAITNAKAIDFAPGAAAGMTAYAGALFCNSADNELYWRTTGGTNVQLTSGTSLNVSAFTGGIGGDYSSIGALLDYDDASDTYRLRQQTSAGVRQFGKVQCADIKLTEYKAAGVSPVPSNTVTIASPAALASSYTLTPPAAVPGSTSIVQMSSAGVLTASNTVANAVTLSSSLSVGTTLGVTGLITATAGLTAAANQHVTVSGTGDIKHGDRVKKLALMSGAGSMSMSGSTVTSTSGVQTWFIDLGLAFRVGDRIKSIQLYYNQAGATGVFLDLRKRTDSTGVSSSISSNTAGSSTGYLNFTISSINYTLVTTETPYIQLSSGQTGDLFFIGVVTYDHP